MYVGIGYTRFKGFCCSNTGALILGMVFQGQITSMWKMVGCLSVLLRRQRRDQHQGGT